MTDNFRSLSEGTSHFSNIYLIVSPPRCSSTAFARVFWEHPEIHFYSHEPFEEVYYQQKDLSRVLNNLKNPLNLESISQTSQSDGREGLVVKDMPYQIGEHFLRFTDLITKPIIFLIRDPRLNIASRIEKKLETGDSINFPLIETGWELLREQIKLCREHAIPHLIVDATEFRNHPEAIFPQIFEKMGLEYSPDILEWDAHPDLEIDNLGGEHTHLYTRALSSTGIQPADEPVPALADFPLQNGFRSHVAFCLEIYRDLYKLPERIRVPAVHNQPLSRAFSTQ